MACNPCRVCDDSTVCVCVSECRCRKVVLSEASNGATSERVCRVYVLPASIGR